MHSLLAVQDDHCFDHWHQATCRNYSVTECRRPVDGPFYGQITAHPFGALVVSDITSLFSDCEMQVTRGPVEIRRDPRDDFMLYLVCRGVVGIEQDGRSVRAEAGDLFIYDQSRPFTLELGDHTRGIVVTIPRPLLVSRLPTSHRLTARRIDGTSRLGVLTAAIVRQLVEFHHPPDADVANRISTSALDILATTLEAELMDSADGEDGCHLKLERVKRYMLANLEDPELTVEAIAAVNNIAPRTLHRLFGIEGTTPIRWLWQQRLASSYKALAEGQMRQVTDAALSHGFADISHFSRAFKKTYGCSPHTLVRR